MFPAFVEEFFRNPATVGSLIPSSRDLTDKVMETIDFERAACIVEYGPGTGVFTDVLMKRRRPETTIVLIEVNRRFCMLLQQRYAGHANVHVVHGSADKTAEHLGLLGISRVDYVVCGLPFSSLPRRLGWRIVQHTQLLLQPAGKLILFQYSLRNTKLFIRFFQLLEQNHVLMNLPPAYVLVYVPKAESPAESARREAPSRAA